MGSQTLDPPLSAEIDLNVIAGRASEDVKLAHKLVAMLQHQIISQDLHEGTSLGTAAEIRARHNVGRWAVREAVGILELRGIARLRRGRGGGVVVTEPDFADLVNLTLLYLYASRSGPREISQVRRSVLTAVVKKLLDGQPGETAPQNEGVIGREVDLPRFLAAQTGNGALALAVEFAESVREACVSPAAAAAGETQATESSLWLAIRRGDRDAALSELDGYLARDERRMADAWMGLPEIAKPRGAADKLAYRLALEILRDVVEHPDRSGDVFGSETEIGRRFDANPEIVRQAIRLVEDLGVVAPRFGRLGGVVLRPPGTASIAALIAHLLYQRRLSVVTCWDAGRFLGDEITRLAAKQMKDSGKLRNRPSAPEEMTLRNVQIMSQQIQTYADTPLLASIERGIGFYSYTIEPPSVLTKHPPADWVIPPIDRVMALSQRVLEAVEAGDVEGASAAMRERFELVPLRSAATASP